MTFQARRALLFRVAPRYHAAMLASERQILNACVAVTSHNRQDAIRLCGQILTQPTNHALALRLGHTAARR